MFSASDLANMRETQEIHMMDTCVIQAVVQTLDSMRELVETWPADSAALACGLDMRPGTERHGTDNIILKYDAAVRLPIATVIDARDRIKVTKRFDEDVELVEATTNLVTNPSFETNTTGWDILGTNTIAQSTEQVYVGLNSLKCTYQDNDMLARYVVVLTANRHSYSVRVYIPTAYDGTQLAAAFVGFIGGSGEAASDFDMDVRDKWQFVDVPNYLISAGDVAGSLRVYEKTLSPTAGRFIYIDAVQCEAKAYSTPYCDGSLGRGHTWADTAHASVSSRAQEMLIYEIAGPIQRGPSGIRVMLNRIET